VILTTARVVSEVHQVTIRYFVVIAHAPASRRITAAAAAPTTATTSASAATSSAAKDTAENLSPNVIGPSHRIIVDVHVARRVVLHRIDQRIELLRVHHVAVESRVATGRVDTVGEKHDRFSSLHATQLFIDDHVDRVVQAGAVAGLRALNCAIELAAIGGEFTQNLDVVVKGNDHHAIVRTQLTDETDRRVLDVFESKLSRGTRVE